MHGGRVHERHEAVRIGMVFVERSQQFKQAIATFTPLRDVVAGSGNTPRARARPKPVKRLRAEHQVNRGIIEIRHLGGTVVKDDAGVGLGGVAHGRVRLDRHHADAAIP